MPTEKEGLEERSLRMRWARFSYVATVPLPPTDRLVEFDIVLEGDVIKRQWDAVRPNAPFRITGEFVLEGKGARALKRLTIRPLPPTIQSPKTDVTVRITPKEKVPPSAVNLTTWILVGKENLLVFEFPHEQERFLARLGKKRRG